MKIRSRNLPTCWLSESIFFYRWHKHRRNKTAGQNTAKQVFKRGDKV